MFMRVTREERAQATVEMAVVAPVMLVVALIVYNVMMFVAATARFDRVAPDIALAHGVASSGDGSDAFSEVEAASCVEEHLALAMDGHDVAVEVTVVGSSEPESVDAGVLLRLVGGLRTYRCTMKYKPWPQGLSVAGVDLGAPLELKHTRDVIVDPWRPGVVV